MATTNPTGKRKRTSSEANTAPKIWKGILIRKIPALNKKANTLKLMSKKNTKKMNAKNSMIFS